MTTHPPRGPDAPASSPAQGSPRCPGCGRVGCTRPRLECGAEPPASDTHFAHYGATNAACDETVPRTVPWDATIGDHSSERFTVRWAAVTCRECLFRQPPGTHTDVTELATQLLADHTLRANEHGSECECGGWKGPHSGWGHQRHQAEAFAAAGLLAVRTPDTPWAKLPGTGRTDLLPSAPGARPNFDATHQARRELGEGWLNETVRTLARELPRDSEGFIAPTTPAIEVADIAVRRVRQAILNHLTTAGLLAAPPRKEKP